jgi:hypothetical protein
MFLAELFFMGVIFMGVGMLVRYLIHPTLVPEAAHAADEQQLLPLVQKHQDSTSTP